MTISKSTLLSITGLLFSLAALISFFGKSNDVTMGVVWLALGATFFGLARKKSRKTS